VCFEIIRSLFIFLKKISFCFEMHDEGNPNSFSKLQAQNELPGWGVLAVGMR
jgi:hypothetical protein